MLAPCHTTSVWSRDMEAALITIGSRAAPLLDSHSGTVPYVLALDTHKAGESLPWTSANPVTEKSKFAMITLL